MLSDLSIVILSVSFFVMLSVAKHLVRMFFPLSLGKCGCIVLYLQTISDERTDFTDEMPDLQDEKNDKMRKISIPWVITVFALLHTMAAVLCRLVHTDDTIALTLLTMTLTVIICVRKKLNMEFIAINVILVNITGYLLGMALAAVFNLFMGFSPVVHGVSTFITTQILGWSIVWFSSFVNDGTADSGVTDSQLSWLFIAVGAVLAIRVLLGSVLEAGLFKDSSMLDVTAAFASNFTVLLLIICSCIIFIQYRKKVRSSTIGARAATLLILFFLLLSSASALIVSYGLPFTFRPDVSPQLFLENLVVALIFVAAVYSISYILDYAVTSRQTMEMERVKANVARMQYINLKQQVNPHFLFNSLNVLDCLVADGQNAQARDFIRKLAGVYRYMLKMESEPVVTLREEMQYADMYAQLLMVRFPEGLKIVRKLMDEDLDRYVVTASVQMLIENAVKHNAVSPQAPLLITISTDGESVSVVNRLIPRMDKPDSTSLGLKYIRKTYLDHGGKDIEVMKTDNEYKVKLPLL